MKNLVPPWVDNIAPDRAAQLVPPAQVAIYVLTGGGLVGRSYAHNPKTAYMDIRLGKRPYSRKQIEAARQTLVALAEKARMDPDSLPDMPDFGNLGVF